MTCGNDAREKVQDMGRAGWRGNRHPADTLITNMNDLLEIPDEDAIFADVSPEVMKLVADEFAKGEQIQATLAVCQQQRIYEACKLLDPYMKRETVLGFQGPKIAPYWRNYWAQREPGIWSDPKELDNFVRDTPELQRPNLGGSSTVRVNGLRKGILNEFGKEVAA